MVLMALMWIWLRFLAKQVAITIEKAISGLVLIIENISKPVIS